MKSQRGFTLLEVMVATTVMGIAVVTLMSALSGSVRNATRLTDYDRAALVARAKMDSLLVDPNLPHQTVLDEPLDPVLLGGVVSGERAVVHRHGPALSGHQLTLHRQPDAVPGHPLLDRAVQSSVRRPDARLVTRRE